MSGEIEYSLDQYYGRDPAGGGDLPPGLDGALRAIFDDLTGTDGPCRRSPRSSLRPISSGGSSRR